MTVTQQLLEGLSPQEVEILGEAAEGVAIIIDERIDRQLTPEVLSKLAFKGITPTQAREYLRAKAVDALRKEYA